jgi:hypothetical protein
MLSLRELLMLASVAPLNGHCEAHVAPIPSTSGFVGIPGRPRSHLALPQDAREKLVPYHPIPETLLAARLDERRALSAWLTRIVLDLARDLRDGRPLQLRVVRGKRIRLVACGAAVHVERQHYRSVAAPSIPR